MRSSTAGWGSSPGAKKLPCRWGSTTAPSRVRPGLRTLIASLAFLFLAACDGGFFVDPPAGGQASLELRIAAGEGGGTARSAPRESGDLGPNAAAARTSVHQLARAGSAEAFERVDRVAVRVVAAEGATLLDEVVRVEPVGGQITVALEFELEGTGADALVEVELRAGQAGLFAGEGSATLERGRTARAEISLAAIPAGIRIPEPPAPLEALGDTLRLDGAVVFATGDTIPGLAVEWESENPAVVSVTSDGVAVAVSQGEAVLAASFGEFRETLPVQVVPVVTQVVVTPAEAQLDPGASMELSAETRDRRGNLLPGREVSWSSADDRIATVDQEGRVEAFRPGAVEITAVSEEGEGSAQITVRLLDPVLRTLAAEGVEATGATLVGDVNPRGTPTEAVFRWGTSSTLQGAALTSPVDVGDGLGAVQVEAELEGLEPFTTYYFRIEASTGAGVFTGPIRSFITLNPIPAPTGLQGQFGDGVVALSWSFDGSGFPDVLHEVERRVDDPEEGFSDWAPLGTSGSTSFTDLEPVAGVTAEYRVRACAGELCSPWSESVSVEVPEAELARVAGAIRLDGEPVASVQVRLSEGALDEPRTTLTLPGGSYAFEEVEAGRYVVEVIPSSADLEDEWFPSRRVEITVFGFGETITVNFDGVSPPPEPQSLGVRWRGSVEASWQAGSGSAAGTTFQVERGLIVDFEIPVWEPAGSTSGLQFTDNPEPGAETWAYRVRACRQASCSPYSAPDSTWVPRTAIWGFVTDQNGNPAPGVFLSIQRIDEEAPFIFGETTDSEGFFTWSDRFYAGNLPNEEDQGPWTFAIESSSDGVSGVVEVEFGQTIRLDLETGSFGQSTGGQLPPERSIQGPVEEPPRPASTGISTNEPGP